MIKMKVTILNLYENRKLNGRPSPSLPNIGIDIYM